MRKFHRNVTQIEEDVGLQPTHRFLHDYWRFSRPLPYQLGLILQNHRIEISDSALYNIYLDFI